jgi:hypothetical protein
MMERGQLFAPQTANPGYNQVRLDPNPKPLDPTKAGVMPLTVHKMNLQEFIKNGILNELVAIFRNQEMAELLLDSIEFPEHLRPIFPNQGRTLGYWQEICKQIQNGVLPAGNYLLRNN